MKVFVEKLRDIHRNPVARGLVARPGELGLESFRHYVSGEVGPVEIELQWTARKREKAGIFPTLRVRPIRENSPPKRSLDGPPWRVRLGAVAWATRRKPRKSGHPALGNVSSALERLSTSNSAVPSPCIRQALPVFSA
jgi:hypothetical protein